MRFGEFYDKICDALSECWDWKAPMLDLGRNPDLLNILFDEYTKHCREDVSDWQGIVASTALKIAKHYDSQ